jgi:hypothetical protein
VSAETPSAYSRLFSLVAAHGALTAAVTEAAHLMAVSGKGQYAEHLDRHRAELNVALGELAVWIKSFGTWGDIDIGRQIHPPVMSPATKPVAQRACTAELLSARESLKAKRATALAKLAEARVTLSANGLPADELTAYRRSVRVWAGEAIDVVAAVHRLVLADSYIRRLARLADNPDLLHREGAKLLHLWMRDLEEADREGELALAESCGYENLVDSYRARI